MFKEYILRKKDLKMPSKTQKTLISESLDPLKTLRDYGIRIKKSVPHKEGYEISLFVNPNDLDLKRILKDFDFFVKDDKIFVKF
jgi:hypothetical protein